MPPRRSRQTATTAAASKNRITEYKERSDRADYITKIDSLARAFIPAIMDFFNSEEGMREFEEWKAQRARKDN